MILDTSAIVAVLNDEPERSAFEDVIAKSDCEVSSVSYLEASIVLLARRGEEAIAALDTWLEVAGIEIVDFSGAHARLARNAYAAFGKGRHPAGLNFGDCAAYALSMDRNDELLFKGENFGHSDVQRAAGTER